MYNEPEFNDDDISFWYDLEERDEIEYERRVNNMRNSFPGYSNESINAGMFLGLEFPYVPGDPGL